MRNEGNIIGPVCYIFVCVSIHHNKRTLGQKECLLGERGRYVNAQALSLKLMFSEGYNNGTPSNAVWECNVGNIIDILPNSWRR